MKTKVRLSRLDAYLQALPEYQAAMKHVRETADALHVSPEALHEILQAYQQVEQIRADYLCEVGFPIREKHHDYCSCEKSSAS